MKKQFMIFITLTLLGWSNAYIANAQSVHTKKKHPQDKTTAPSVTSDISRPAFFYLTDEYGKVTAYPSISSPVDTQSAYFKAIQRIRKFPEFQIRDQKRNPLGPVFLPANNNSVASPKAPQ